MWPNNSFKPTQLRGGNVLRLGRSYFAAAKPVGLTQALAPKVKVHMRSVKVASILLAIVSIPYLLVSSYEMFVLTPRHGPQMLFFSAFHSWPDWLITMFVISWLIYYVLLAASAVITLSALFVKFKTHPKLVQSMQVTFCFLTVHLVLSLSYGYWSASLFGR